MISKLYSRSERFSTACPVFLHNCFVGKTPYAPLGACEFSRLAFAQKSSCSLWKIFRFSSIIAAIGLVLLLPFGHVVFANTNNHDILEELSSGIPMSAGTDFVLESIREILGTDFTINTNGHISMTSHGVYSRWYFLELEGGQLNINDFPYNGRVSNLIRSNIGDVVITRFGDTGLYLYIDVGQSTQRGASFREYHRIDLTAIVCEDFVNDKWDIIYEILGVEFDVYYYEHYVVDDDGVTFTWQFLTLVDDLDIEDFRPSGIVSNVIDSNVGDAILVRIGENAWYLYVDIGLADQSEWSAEYRQYSIFPIESQAMIARDEFTTRFNKDRVRHALNTDFTISLVEHSWIDTRQPDRGTVYWRFLDLGDYTLNLERFPHSYSVGNVFNTQLGDVIIVVDNRESQLHIDVGQAPPSSGFSPEHRMYHVVSVTKQ